MKNTSIRRTAAALAIGGAVAATMSMPAANAVDGATWDARGTVRVRWQLVHQHR